jgi:DNA-directed RNA polymerase, mitochondrial
LGTSQILKQLGILDAATDMSSRRRRAPADAAIGADGTAVEEDEVPAEVVDQPPTVSLLSKEQALKLLEPVGAKAKQTRRGASAGATPQGKGESLEGKFVDLVDLLPPMPTKGEFDVNKIKSSLYFFS